MGSIRYFVRNGFDANSAGFRYPVQTASVSISRLFSIVSTSALVAILQSIGILFSTGWVAILQSFGMLFSTASVAKLQSFGIDQASLAHHLFSRAFTGILDVRWMPGELMVSDCGVFSLALLRVCLLISLWVCLLSLGSGHRLWIFIFDL